MKFEMIKERRLNETFVSILILFAIIMMIILLLLFVDFDLNRKGLMLEIGGLYSDSSYTKGLEKNFLNSTKHGYIRISVRDNYNQPITDAITKTVIILNGVEYDKFNLTHIDNGTYEGCVKLPTIYSRNVTFIVTVEKDNFFNEVVSHPFRCATSPKMKKFFEIYDISDTATYSFAGYGYACNAYLNFYRKTGDSYWRNLGLNYADYLVVNRDVDNDGEIGWGKNTSWDAFGDGTINPPNQEYALGTNIDVSCLLSAYEISNNSEFLSVVEEAINDTWANGELFYCDSKECWYYWYSTNPNDKGRYVKNTNILYASNLAKLYRITANPIYAERARQVVNAELWEIDTNNNFAYLGKKDPEYESNMCKSKSCWTHLPCEAYALLEYDKIMQENHTSTILKITDTYDKSEYGHTTPSDVYQVMYWDRFSRINPKYREYATEAIQNYDRGSPFALLAISGSDDFFD